MPPEGAEMAHEIIRGIQHEGGSNVQKVMAGIKALQWLRSQLIVLRNNVTPSQEIADLARARQRLRAVREGAERLRVMQEALQNQEAFQYPYPYSVPSPSWDLAEAA